MRQGDKLRVIVFEDNKAVSDLLRKFLQSFGCEVQAFTDPTVCDAIATSACACPKETACADILITDMMMPNMTGLELLKLQRKRGCKALDANKALVTASCSSQLQIDVEELGSKYINKPFRMSELREWD